MQKLQRTQTLEAKRRANTSKQKETSNYIARIPKTNNDTATRLMPPAFTSVLFLLSCMRIPHTAIFAVGVLIVGASCSS